jgi:hypothetical protein
MERTSERTTVSKNTTGGTEVSELQRRNKHTGSLEGTNSEV